MLPASWVIHWDGDVNSPGTERGRRDTYISMMPSGRLAGISVKPFPLQSTMLLLQVQAEGQEMELALQDGGSEWGPVGPEHSGQLVAVPGAAWAAVPLNQLRDETALPADK